MLGEIIGECPAIKRFRRNLPQLAKESTTLILTGEGGSGKAFLAAHIHAASPLNSAPIECLNFSVLTERDQRIGLLGGEPPDLTTTRRSILELKTTVVLKHIDSAGSYLQDSLAAALTSLTIVRPGSSERRRLLARVILTFRNSIPAMTKKKAVTSKLLEALGSTQRAHLPSLRARRDDIPLLARHYAMKLEDNFRRPERIFFRGITPDGSMSSDLLEVMRNDRWDDNVRDLIAFIRALALLPLKREIFEREILEVLKMTMMIDAEEEFSLPAKLAVIERGIVARALQKMNHNKTLAAQILGLSERGVGRRSVNFP